MSGLAKWKIHGPVETLRTEFATWDLKQEDWQPVKHFTVTSFRPDGTVSTSEFHYSDGSVVHTRWLYDDVGRLTEVNSWFNDGPIGRVVYFYDEAGRHVRTVQLSHIGTQTDSEICSYDAGGKRTKVHFLGLPGLNTFIGDTDRGYGSPGATMMTVTYDEKDLPTKVLFQDAKHNPLRYVIYVRDSAGRLLNEELHVGGDPLLQDLVKKAVGETLSSTTYVYDTRGRLLEQTNRTGSLGEERTTYRYDDHDDPIEATTEHRDREATINQNGTVHYSSEHLNVHHSRLEYRYDAQGNWTERIVSIRPEPNPDFQRSNIERRAITYHAA